MLLWTGFMSLIKQYKSGLCLVVLTWFIFFSPIISGQYAYFLDDLKIIYYPIETLYAQFQHSWQLPVWANEFGFGQPLLAWGQLGFFTPLHLIMRALYIPPLALLQISVVAYFLLGSLGMFVFLVRRNLHQTAAALGAVTFTYCGFNIGHLNHVNFYTSTMLLPFLLIAIDALIKKGTLARATTLALVASLIAVSGQPQVVLYVYIVAFAVGLAMLMQHWNTKAIIWTMYAAIVAFLLSLFALLPLQEFIPQTERGHGLPMEELFEFSYPAYNTITLVLPYFWGGHADYSGPKGFQELAAYTGILPLILAGVAIASWRLHKGERIAGIFLITLGILLALGKHSAIYRFLVENHYITSIGVVGRFIFFFDIGIVLLASIGLNDLLVTKGPRRIICLLTGYILPTLLIVIPFWVFAASNPEAIVRFVTLFNIHTVTFWLIVLAVATPIIAIFRKIAWILPLITASTLVYYGWNYNPRVPSSQAYNSSAFVQDLKQFKETTHLPARLYAAERLPVTGNPMAEIKLSDTISPLFTVFQPLVIQQSNLRCLIIPIQADSSKKTEMHAMIRSGFTGTIWHQQIISSEEVFKHTNQKICFSSIPASEHENLILSFSSNEETNMKVFVSPSKNDESKVYFLRVQNPTTKQLEESKKQFSVQYAPEFTRTVDTENALMVRHIQAVAGASSARWIGALSLKPYREFVDSFLANDSEAFDGDGLHALTRNKKLVDMIGITHFTQLLDYGQTNDPMLTQGYELVREADTGESLIRLYKNPDAYPKAYIVPKGEFVAADDEIRFRLRDPLYDPRAVVYISGSTPPIETTPSSTPLIASATITNYTNIRVDIETTSDRDAFLVLTDSSSNEWQTFIDNVPALPLKANSIFKTAQIPAGTHTVSFRYVSPAIQKSKILTSIGITLIIIGYAYQPLRNRKKT
ncbi:MAG TPA: hypothetical protein VJI96_04615 [Candidatus Andersenbacteria bacterium]|nr:hypothetical protein [Candidatus Andersenbacteria bacterium]